MDASLHLADLFAGGGGFSEGVAEACASASKTPDVVAVNHWEIAARTYKQNHPHAKVLCTGLDSVIPTAECPGGRLDLLAASPECTHHSNARGGRPMSDQSRASAWLILKWLQELYVDAVPIENVQEFADWGPLGADGRPLKKMRGALFGQFISSLKALGYNVEWRVICSADYGGATTRERLFIMARRGRNKRIVWPDKTHAPLADIQPELFSAKSRWRSAREIIDWSIPSQSIFTRKKPLAKSALERIAAGLRKFGGKTAEPFLLVLRNHMDARPLSEPLPALTASGTHLGLVEPFVIGQQSGATPRSVGQPLPTVATDGAISIVEPYLLSMEHGGACRPFITTVNHGMPGRNRNGHRVYDIDQPMPTITTVDAWGVVQPFIVPQFGEREGQAPRCRSIDNPLPTVTSHGAGALVQPFLVEYHGNHAGRTDGDRRVRSANEPLPTQTTENRFGVLEPLLLSYYGTHNATPVSEPLRTVTTRDRFCMVQFAEGLYLDIHFRMLTWRELARAMGFPDSYEFFGTREEKVRQIGNAVEVHTAAALARAALAA